MNACADGSGADPPGEPLMRFQQTGCDMPDPTHPSDADDDAADEGTPQEDLEAEDLEGFVKDPHEQ